MKHPPRFMKCLLLCFFSLMVTQVSLMASTASTSASSSSEDALLESMEARLPALMKLKLNAAVGETNLGLIEARGVLERDQRRLIADENRDRLAYYQLIAGKLGVPVAAVQRKRAEQIRENSPAGVWIQSKAGIWNRK